MSKKSVHTVVKKYFTAKKNANHQSSEPTASRNLLETVLSEITDHRSP